MRNTILIAVFGLVLSGCADQGRKSISTQVELNKLEYLFNECEVLKQDSLYLRSLRGSGDQVSHKVEALNFFSEYGAADQRFRATALVNYLFSHPAEPFDNIEEFPNEIEDECIHHPSSLLDLIVANEDLLRLNV